MRDFHHHAEIFSQIQNHLDRKRAVCVCCDCPDYMAWLVRVVAIYWDDAMIAITVKQGHRQAYLVDFTFPVVASNSEADMENTSQQKPSLAFKKFNNTVERYKGYKQWRCALVSRVMQGCNGSVPMAAKQLQIAPSTLYRWLREDS